VRGLAAAVGALGLAVREPPPAVVAEDLRGRSLWVRGRGGLRPRRVREVLRLRLRPSAGIDRRGLLRLLGLARLFLALPLDLRLAFRAVGALGLDLGQQGVQPGVLKRLFGGRPAARLRPKGRRFRPCVRVTSDGSPVSNRCFFGSRGPPRFRPRREVREFGPCPEGSPEGDNGACYTTRMPSVLPGDANGAEPAPQQ
jgi:hypothetical protein